VRLPAQRAAQRLRLQPRPGSIHHAVAKQHQLAREAVLASSSDWPFTITMGTTVPYAERRIRTHINRFNWLLKRIDTHAIDVEWVTKLEACDNIFEISTTGSSHCHRACHTGIPLRLDSGVWEAARIKAHDERSVIGWYHSHPNLRVFFSGIDTSCLNGELGSSRMQLTSRLER